ncbi:MAG: metallophosphoesterase [Pseudomonadota bacterium]
MIIAQISDTHIAADHPKGPEREDHLRRCVAAINRLDPLPDVVVHTGDLTHRAKPEEFDRALAILDELKPPFHLVAGNRDERDAMRSVLGARLTADWPFVQYANEDHAVRLIILDSLSGTSNKGDFCTRRLDHLEALLAREPEKPVALFFHHPPFDVMAAKDPFQYESRENVARLAEVLDQGGQEIRIFCGHSHRLARGQVGRVEVTTLPSVAVDLRLGDYPLEQQGRPLFQLHRHSPGAGFTTTTHAVADGRS